MNSKLKEYRFPQIRLDILLTELNKLYEKNDDRIFTKEKMSEDIRASPISSSIPAKIFELKNFGLLEGDHQHLHITELGRKIFQVSDAQRSIELEKVIRNIKIWDVIQNLGGKNFTGPEIVDILIKSGRLNEQEIKQLLPEIRSAFLRDIACITKFRPKTIHAIQVSNLESKKGQLLPSSTYQSEEKQPPKNDHDTIKMSIQYGRHSINIVDELTFRFAEQMMKSMKKELEKHGEKFEI